MDLRGKMWYNTRKRRDCLCRSVYRTSTDSRWKSRRRPCRRRRTFRSSPTCLSSRVRIFWLLCHCEECVINLSSIVGMSSPAVSHHLRQLKNSGLIVSRREGKEVYYRAADTEQAQLLHHMIEKMVEIACPDA